MPTETLGRFVTRGMTATAGVVLGMVVVVGHVHAADGVDPEVDKVLRSMSAYLGGLSSFSVNAAIGTEVIDLQGQKIQNSSSSTITIERPNNLHVMRQGVLADAEIIVDGKTLTIYGKERNVYFQTEKQGNIDQVIDAIRTGIGLDAPAADLMYADPYPTLASGVNSSAYLGTAFVNGIECHHLAFREDMVDWQLWVKAGDQPLPMKYIVTTKWMTAAPQYSVRFHDWDTEPNIEKNRFSFSAPNGAKRLTAIAVDHVGEAILAGEQQ